MTSGRALCIEHLYLRNFRCFETCAMDIDPELTVLVAENGGGKSAVLDALALALALFVDNVSGTKQGVDFVQTDLRLVPNENGIMTSGSRTEFAVFGHAGEELAWSGSRTRFGPRTRTDAKGAKELVDAAQQLRERVQAHTAGDDEAPPLLPLVAFYATDRLWSDKPPVRNRKGNSPGDGRMSGYAGCLSSSSSVKDVVAWYETKMTQAGDSRFSLEQPAKLVSAVEKAMQVVLGPTGWCKLDWDFENKRLLVGHREQGWLPLTALSDGVRTMVALVMDIARRCASLNPHLGEDAAEKTPGILLIDEVDLHLHPRWQQQIVTLLRHAFPLVQLILTTHSPQVLSAVDKKYIRVIHLRDGKALIETPWFQTRGVESANVLAYIMGVDPVPPVEEAQWLNNYRALIEDGQSEGDQAQVLRHRLVSHFGLQHPVMQECDRIIRLERFKKNLPPQRRQRLE